MTTAIRAIFKRGQQYVGFWSTPADMLPTHEPAGESVAVQPLVGLGPREVLASFLALFLCLFIVFVAHNPLVPANDEFDPSKCTAASKLSEYWDGYMKAQG